MEISKWSNEIKREAPSDEFHLPQQWAEKKKAEAEQSRRGESSVQPGIPADDLGSGISWGSSRRVGEDAVAGEVGAAGGVFTAGSVIYRGRATLITNAGRLDEATGYDLAQAPAGFAPSPDQFDPIVENEFLDAKDNPLSTFAFDVDTASWPLIRRFLNNRQQPPKSAVRIEEMINYFPYDYAPPADPAEPFAVRVETMDCPWAPAHKLLRVGIKAKSFAANARPARNLTFLVDVSGSMDSPDRLPLVVEGLQRLAGQLDGRDRVSLVTYANGVNTVLDSATGGDRAIAAALGRLRASGGTYGEGGIQRAYELARKNFIPGAANRVILCTDGDFNIGITDRETLGAFLEKESRDGVFLTALGFGMGNHKDAMLEWLSNKGHGFHSYVDSPAEAARVFGDAAEGALVTVAKDVKVQVEFNPAHVGQYRLIGYEHRLLAKEDFNDDAKDGGDIGAGHTATALYEWTPPGRVASGRPAVDPLRYQATAAVADGEHAGELLTVKIRYKTPEGKTSLLREFPVRVGMDAAPSGEFRFAAGVAAFGLVLRDSKFKGAADAALAARLAKDGLDHDPSGLRAEFVRLVEAYGGGVR